MRKATIVIADDDPLTREACKAVLEQQGHTVYAAEDGDKAIALVETYDVQIALLDILMPHKEGLETLLEFRRRFPDLIVFVMSSGGGRANETDFLSFARKLGASGALRKPFQPQALYDLIASCDREPGTAAAAR